MNFTTSITVNGTKKSERRGGLDDGEVSKFQIKPGEYDKELDDFSELLAQIELAAANRGEWISSIIVDDYDHITALICDKIRSHNGNWENTSRALLESNFFLHADESDLHSLVILAFQEMAKYTLESNNAKIQINTSTGSVLENEKTRESTASAQSQTTADQIVDELLDRKLEVNQTVALPEANKAGEWKKYIFQPALLLLACAGTAAYFYITYIAPPNNPTPYSLQASELYVVASLAANIREKASTRSNVLYVVKQGDRLKRINSIRSHYEVELSDGRRGYISSDLIISETDFDRLSKLSASQYLESKSEEMLVNTLFEKIQPFRSEIIEIYSKVSARDWSFIDQLKEIELKSSSIRFPEDTAAGTWYSLSAKVATEEGKIAQALEYSRAAIEANPVNVDYHSAFGFLNYSNGNSEAVKAASMVLGALAPQTTNTWMLVGLAEAMDREEPHFDLLATGSFLLAIRLSKNQVATRRYIKQLAEKSDSQRLKILLYAALAEDSGVKEETPTSIALISRK